MNTRCFFARIRPARDISHASIGRWMETFLVPFFLTRIKIRAEGACQNDSINAALQHPLQIPLKILNSFRFFLRHVLRTCCVHGTISLPSLFHQHPVFCWLSHRLETQKEGGRGGFAYEFRISISPPSQPSPTQPPVSLLLSSLKEGRGSFCCLVSPLPSPPVPMLRYCCCFATIDLA